MLAAVLAVAIAAPASGASPVAGKACRVAGQVAPRELRASGLSCREAAAATRAYLLDARGLRTGLTTGESERASRLWASRWLRCTERRWPPGGSSYDCRAAGVRLSFVVPQSMQDRIYTGRPCGDLESAEHLWGTLDLSCAFIADFVSTYERSGSYDKRPFRCTVDHVKQDDGTVSYDYACTVFWPMDGRSLITYSVLY
jgi:hypothetical protein